ncbi:MAG: rhodanese-like domain-containing protein [Candidatus Bathyarchaeia archaeon]
MNVGVVEEEVKVKKALMAIAIVLLFALSTFIPQCVACFVPICFKPIVSTDWLMANLVRPNLVILDIRSPEKYNAGHVPGAINVPGYMWYVNPPFGEEFPWMEMPSKRDLFKLISEAGITQNSLVVVVGSTSGPLSPVPLALYNTATITRVAITLLYAGVENVVILDGGFEKWAAEGKPISTEPVTPKPVKYKGCLDRRMLVSIKYVYAKIGKSIIVDARDEIVYNCMVTEPWTAYAGHIPTAKNLPTPSLWDIHMKEDGSVAYITYKDPATLKRMIVDVVGRDKSREIIVYCGVGGYASTTYFLLSEVFSYCNVRFYDGSAQEWTNAGMPVECP